MSDVNNMSIQNFQAKVIYGPATSVTQNFDLFPNNVASDFTANLVFMMPSQTKFYAVNITEVNSFNQSTQNQIFNQSGEFKNKSVDLQFSFQLYKVYHVNTYYELPSMEPSSTIWFNFISREAYKPIIDWMLVVVYFKELAYECYGPCIVPFGNEVTRPHEQGTDLNGIIYSSQIVKGQNTQGFGFTLITVHKMVGLIRQVLFALITGLIILVVDFAVSSRRRSQLSA
ncbi:hypothetical protein HYS54_04590 [Candidatus Micrarchaeota archaeon]|nr:hypothetical protein [Candidatus Micrarchaeota archaeon]